MPSLPDQIPQNLRPIVTVRLRSRRTWPTVALAVGVAAAALAALLVALTTGGACGS